MMWKITNLKQFELSMLINWINYAKYKYENDKITVKQ